MADNDRWGDRDRDWREDRSWNEGRGRERYGARGRSQGGDDRWRQMHQDRRHEGPAGYNTGGPAQGGWQFGDPEQGGERGQGYERYGYGRGEAQRYAEPGRGYYDEFGRDPGVGSSREYGRGGGYGASSQTARYAGQGGYGISAQGTDYRSGGESRYAYGAHTPYGYRGRNEFDERGRGGEYADDGRREEGRSWLERAGEKVSAFFGAEDEGRYRGRGPKGYRRSDDRIREDVSDRLTDDPWLDASSIEVEVRECEVVLKGAVNSREDKRRAEHLSEAISGVRNVQNHLRVEDGQSTTYGQTTTTTGRTTASAAAPDKDPKGERRLQAPDAAPGLNT